MSVESFATCMSVVHMTVRISFVDDIEVPSTILCDCVCTDENHTDDDDCFYYHSWRNNVVIAFGTLSSFLT